MGLRRHRGYVVFIVYLVHLKEVNSLTCYLSPPAPQDPKSPPSPIITQPAQHILNDTSLAAVSLANGDRQLFFQDNTGLIRRAYYTASNSEWSTESSLSINTTAKNYTPLAVTVTQACSGCATQVVIKASSFIVLTQTNFYVDYTILYLRKPYPKFDFCVLRSLVFGSRSIIGRSSTGN